LGEKFVICRRCGREIPKTLYCIYCGSALSDEEKTPDIEFPEFGSAEMSIESVEPRPFPDVPDDSYFQTPQDFKMPVETPVANNEESDPDTAHVIAELKKLQLWRLNLCRVLADGKVTIDVFKKIYDEYVGDIDRLDEIRSEMISHFQGQYEDKLAQLKNSEMDREELQVRAEIGQIQESELMVRMPEITDRISALTLETSKLESKLSQLNNPLGEMPPKDVLELEKATLKNLESLDGLVADGRLGDELRTRIQGDLDSVLTMFDGVLGVKKEAERELMNELDTLEVRFKVGEITLSEYESLRQGVLNKLEQLWV
jgi:hypothetical protein